MAAKGFKAIILASPPTLTNCINSLGNDQDKLDSIHFAECLVTGSVPPVISNDFQPNDCRKMAMAVEELTVIADRGYLRVKKCRPATRPALQPLCTSP